MGMAASQARYLALVARKSNCEYEGQQINQARLILSNQSANLFTQMLGLQVPVAPSKEDFATLQYSFDVNGTAYTMTKWSPLSDEDSDGGYWNYAVTYHYDKDIEQGTQKIKSKPQVAFSGAGPTGVDENYIKTIEEKLLNLQEKKAEYEKARDDYNALCDQASKLSYFVNNDFRNLGNDPAHFNKETVGDVTTYTITSKDDEPVVRTYVQYDEDGEYAEVIQDAVQKLIDMGAVPESAYKNTAHEWIPANLKNIYYDATQKTLAFQSDIDAVGNGTSTYLNEYYTEQSPTNHNGIKETADAIAKKQAIMDTAKTAYQNAELDYNALSVPIYVGNIELKPIAEFSETQLADIKLIIADMKEQGIECNIAKCFETDSALYNNATYAKHGGIYMYEQYGITYYTTYYDLVNSYIHGTGINHLDDQSKLPTYTVQKVTTPINTTEKAILETDAKGRFTSIRLESDSAVYALKSEKTYDNVAYDDAMNQYDYEKALYDKRVSDLNAQTSLIQRQDQDLELRLKQLDTEQNALATEIDAVAKVVKDNIEKSFKTFGG